jgi:hypothetical protein
MVIKCVGCYHLVRKDMRVNPEHWKSYKLKGDILTTYECPKFFEYCTTLDGLLRPGKATLEAVKLCHEEPLSHCALCSEPPSYKYGYPEIAAACKKHHQSWTKWLDEHPDRRAHLAPRGRAVRANWIEVFREFIEDMRRNK